MKKENNKKSNPSISEIEELWKRDFGCKKHKHKGKKLGYLAWHQWAEEQQKKGLRQKQCPKCKLWFWPEEY